MKYVFESTVISGIPFRNRIIRSATHEGLADERGAPTEKLIALYEKLARGSVGGIITGECCVHKSGKSSGYRPLMIDDDGLIEPYRRVVDAVHAFECPIILQLQHAGRQTTSEVLGTSPVAPSPIKDAFYSTDVPRELTTEEIEEIIHAFIVAAHRAMRAGFDGVQLLAAHGYLLSEFLSPAANKRKDQWGGSIENRFKIVKYIIDGIKKICGNDFPVFVKINASEAARGGMRLQEAVRIAKMLEKHGCAVIEVSCGTFADGLNSIRGPKLPLEAAFQWIPKYREYSNTKQRLFRVIAPMLIKRHKPFFSYNLKEAHIIRQNVQIPVIVVGGMHRLRDITHAIESRKVDLVSMSRPFIAEPNIVEKFLHGQEASRCIMCNYCSIGLLVGPLRCYRGRIDVPGKMSL